MITKCNSNVLQDTVIEVIPTRLPWHHAIGGPKIVRLFDTLSRALCCMVFKGSGKVLARRLRSYRLSLNSTTAKFGRGKRYILM